MKLRTEIRTNRGSHPASSQSLTRTGVMRRAEVRGPVPMVPFRNSAYVPQKAVGSFVPKITKNAFEKFGFPAAALLTDWSKIVGTDIAAYTVPERLKWARRIGEPVEGGETGSGRPAATLIVRVDPARALDVEYKTQLLMDRINAYFGYRAVGTIKIVQGLIEAEKRDAATVGKSRPTAAGTLEPTNGSSAPASDDPLTAALARLGSKVSQRRGG